MTPTRPDYLHYSQISTYLLCKHKHDLAYIERLEPVTRAARMDFGTFGHAALADLWLGTHDRFAQAVAEAVDGTDDPSDARRMCETAEVARKVAERVFVDLNQKFEVYEDHVEKTLVYPVFGKPFGGTPDVIVRDRGNGSVWILDYKFRQTFCDPETELLNLQMITYQWLAQEMGIPVVGTRQVQIRPILPKVPRLNKDGTMSKADIYSDWPTYSQAVIVAGLDPTKYEDMKDKLAQKEFWEYDSCRALRTPEELQYHAKNEIAPAIKAIMARTEPGPGRIFNHLVCSWCSYRELCVEEAKGGHIEFMKQTLYKIKGTPLARLPILED